MPDPLNLRQATLADIDAIEVLMRESTRALSAGFYDVAEIESAVRYITVPDRQLVQDGTFFVAGDESSLVACGGWSRREKLFTGRQVSAGDSRLLDPAREPARVRAMFVHPRAARRGLGRRILERCEAEAAAAGFRRLELMATLPGVPLYEACGYKKISEAQIPLPGGAVLRGVIMGRTIDPKP
ncbi:MAG: GNAT family N-acetyltransferase [Acidobacteriota bacterium]